MLCEYDRRQLSYPPAWDRESDIECEDCHTPVSEDEDDDDGLCYACAKDKKDKEEDAA